MVRPTSKRMAGFTLVEVLVALAILAIGLTTAVRVVSGFAANADHMRGKTMAMWVAMNKINEAQVLLANAGTGREHMGGKEWFWELTITRTPVQELRRLDIKVFAHENASEPLAQLVAFAKR